MLHRHAWALTLTFAALAGTARAQAPSVVVAAEPDKHVMRDCATPDVQTSASINHDDLIRILPRVVYLPIKLTDNTHHPKPGRAPNIVFHFNANDDGFATANDDPTAPARQQLPAEHVLGLEYAAYHVMSCENLVRPGVKDAFLRMVQDEDKWEQNALANSLTSKSSTYTYEELHVVAFTNAGEIDKRANFSCRAIDAAYRLCVAAPTVPATPAP